MTPLRWNRVWALLPAVALIASLAAPSPVLAQLGTSANPPPENLFQFKDPPKLRNDGLGTMAERRRAMARAKARRPVPRTPR